MHQRAAEAATKEKEDALRMCSIASEMVVRRVYARFAAATWRGVRRPESPAARAAQTARRSEDMARAIREVGRITEASFPSAGTGIALAAMAGHRDMHWCSPDGTSAGVSEGARDECLSCWKAAERLEEAGRPWS